MTTSVSVAGCAIRTRVMLASDETIPRAYRHGIFGTRMSGANRPRDDSSGSVPRVSARETRLAKEEALSGQYAAESGQQIDHAATEVAWSPPATPQDSRGG